MAYLLFIVLIITEIGFCVFELTRTSPKKEWTSVRLILDLVQLVLFFLMVLLPGIDLGFRFTALIAVLVLRVIVSFIFVMAYRKNDKVKKKVMIVFSSIVSVILILVNMVPSFIFADYNGRPLTGKYQIKEDQIILTDTSRLETFENDGSYREIPVHFYYPDDPSIQSFSLPLVIFSHGAFGYYQSNASTFMELASHGYVVASLDHPYHSFFTKDSDGKLITVDPEFLQSAMYIGQGDDDMSEESLFEITSKWMELREADVNFVVDELKTGEFTQEWGRLMDTGSIGLFGHSLGGATMVTVGRRDDIKAVIDIDGTMLGEQTGVMDGMPVANVEPYTTPLLSIDNDEHHQSREQAREIGYTYTNNVILDNATEGFSTYFKGAAHMDLTDLPLFSPFLAGMLNYSTSSVDHEECTDTLNALVLDFFDCYLKGEGEFAVKESYL